MHHGMHHVMHHGMQDVLLLKLLRGLAAHEGTAARLVEYCPDLLQLLQQLELPELLVELLGTPTPDPNSNPDRNRWP